MRAIRLEPDCPPELVEVGNGWRDFSAAIGHGEYIERVGCSLTIDHDLVLVVDEEGLYHDVPLNPLATAIYAGDLQSLRTLRSPIVGTALLMQEGMGPEGPDFIDLEDPDAALALVTQVVEGFTTTTERST